MAKVSKRFAEAEKLVDRDRHYSVEESVELAKKAATAKFYENV